jgi:hypothetical protein
MKLQQFLQDDTGQLSANRLAFLSATFIVLIIFAISCVKAGWKIVPIDTSVLYLVGIFMAGKVSQSFSENISGNSKTMSTTST